MSNNTYILFKNGELYVCGNNISGQLGLGHNESKSILTLLYPSDTNDIGIKSIHCGTEHIMIYKKDSKLFVFGCNSHGQLGLNDTKDRNRPILLMEDTQIASIHCGAEHSIIYKNDGSLYVFGYNKNKQLALDDTINRYKPTLCMVDKRIGMISCGGYYSIIYKNDKLTNDKFRNRKLTNKILTNNKVVNNKFINDKLKYNGLYVFSCNSDNDKSILSLDTNDNNDIKMISCGYAHSLIYKNNGDLFIFI